MQGSSFEMDVAFDILRDLSSKTLEREPCEAGPTQSAIPDLEENQG